MQLDILSSLPEKSQRDLPRVVNRLLGQVFLYQDKDEDKDDYYFVHRHREACEAAPATGWLTICSTMIIIASSRPSRNIVTAAPITNWMRP